MGSEVSANIEGSPFDASENRGRTRRIGKR